MKKEYLSTKQIAILWKLSERSVRNYCSQGKVPGAILSGKIWLIPANAQKPQRQSRFSNKNRTLLEVLNDEKESSLKGGIYHKIMIEMTYNSNHMEGSKLSHDQTRHIFETKTLGVTDKQTNVDDIIETVNHFRCIDLVIDAANYKLSETFIKQLHNVLKRGTSDSFKPWFKVGDYKALANEVGGHNTVDPKQVKQEMVKLLKYYNSIENITIEDIIDFHVKFESIHPFQDGNGRIGRLIMLKECLKHNIVPIIILDEYKDFYYRGLKEWNNEKGYLIDTCLYGQDIFKSYLDKLGIKY